MTFALAMKLVALTTLAAPTFVDLAPASPPGTRRSCSEGLRGTTEMFIYGGFSGGTLGDLNLYDLSTNTWTPLTDPFPARERHAMAYDPVHDRVAIVGGASTLTLNDTVFLIDGATRAGTLPASPATRPSARVDAALHWVPSLNRFVYWAGRTNLLSNSFVADTWLLDVADGGVTWANVTPAGSPTARGAACTVWDSTHEQMLSFGGEVSGASSTETWRWTPDGGAWTNLTMLVTGTVPSARAFCATEWDPLVKRMVLYGGQVGGNPASGLFSFDPVTMVWTSHAQPSPSPGNLSDAAAAYSAGRKGIVLFGGRLSSSTYSNQTWLLKMNDPPVVDAGADQQVSESAMVSLSGTATDDTPGFTVSWRQLAGPAVMLSSTTSTTPSFTSPRVTASTVLTFSLTADDGIEAPVTDSVDVTVLNTINEPPAADAGPPQAAAAGAMVQLSGSGSDPNGSMVTFQWMQVSGPAVSLSSTVVPSPTFVAPSSAMPSTLDFQLVVNDGVDPSAPAVTRVDVAAAPQDAGPPDAGPPDAGPPDAGPPDAGPPDAGPPDAGPPDAGPPDAGTPDAGTPDAGEPDAGEMDAGLADAGPADDGGTDAGTDDGGSIDGGPSSSASYGVACGCGTSGPIELIALLLALITAGRRRGGP